MKQNLGYPPAGSVIFNGYWREHARVISHNGDGTVTMRWHGDARVSNPQPPRETTHLTQWDKARDKVVCQPRQTKWDFLSPEDRAGYDATPLGITCSGCGAPLPTEGDFARHFYIPDFRFLNLGWCPVKDAAGPRTVRS